MRDRDKKRERERESSAVATPPSPAKLLPRSYLAFPLSAAIFSLAKEDKQGRVKAATFAYPWMAPGASCSESIMLLLLPLLLPLGQIPRIDILPVSAYFSINLAKHWDIQYGV